jgi:hypothetical protein
VGDCGESESSNSKEDKHDPGQEFLASAEAFLQETETPVQGLHL